MSALPLKADLFQDWRLGPLLTQSGHRGVDGEGKGIWQSLLFRTPGTVIERAKERLPT